MAPNNAQKAIGGDNQYRASHEGNRLACMSFDNGNVQLYQSDARSLPLADESVDCCVTSPPYWGLRDYGVEGQLGLEPTPELYVDHMIEVFREVRRVLKPEGVVFLNLGDCYVSSPRGNKPGDYSTSSLTNPQRQDRVPRGDEQRGGGNGSGGRARLGSIERGDASQSLCDECEAVLALRSPGSDSHHVQVPASSPFGSSRSRKGRQPAHAGSSHSTSQDGQSVADPSGSRPSPDPADARPLASQVSTSHGSSPQSQAACSHCPRCGACRDVLASVNPHALACGRTGWRLDMRDIESSDHPSGGHNSGNFSSRTAPLDFTSNLKPKDLVGIPWMVAFALRADGWWLRSDIIWNKPNPMPESVTDRPTRAHEYIFLLTKSARYYYDQTAIAEPHGAARSGTWSRANHDARLNHGAFGERYEDKDGLRNKRTVWEVATQPYAEAHFATFPEKLIEPCILAGCPEGGTVLDPFSGSGTTAAVAQRLGRRAVGTDVNQEYLAMAARRIEKVTLPMDLAIKG